MRHALTQTPGSPLQHPFFRPSDTLRMASWVPPLDLTEVAGAYHVTLELPGVKPTDIEVNYDQGTLVIRGEKRSERERVEGTWRRTERVYGSFERAVRIGAAVDVERIEAVFNDGTLTIELPKAEAARPRQIDVQGGSQSASRTVDALTENPASETTDEGQPS